MSCGAILGRVNPRDSAAELEKTIASYNDAWNAQDVETILSFHAPGMVFENHTAGDRVEGDAVGPHIAGIFARNPDLRFTGRRLYARDGLVVSEWTATATNRAGQRVEWDGIDVFPFENGLDPAQGRLLVLARSARDRRIGVPRPRVHEAAGVPAEIERELAESFELVASAERGGRRRRHSGSPGRRRVPRRVPARSSASSRTTRSGSTTSTSMPRASAESSSATRRAS